MNTLLSALFIPAAQNSTGSSGLPSWVIFLILLVLLVAVIWYLTRPKKEAAETASPEAAPEEKMAAVTATAVKTEETQPEPAPTPEPQTEPTPAPAPAPETKPEPEPVKPDDLKKIEGIGPKIESVLNAAAITTYAQLANTSVADLDKIVRQDAGITIAHPATWPKQAQMAADDQWDKLAAYQDELHGGRQIKK